MEEIINRIRQRAAEVLERRGRVVLAIDGSCASGKTTLAAALAADWDCNVFHVDDFFLRPEQRTGERLAQVGGNVDYERFREEVLLPLGAGQAFSYRPYDCKTGTLKPPVWVVPKAINIVEGTYSQHPYFGDAYDLRLVLTVSETVRTQRILARPEHLHRRFFEEWIPKEQAYFAAFAIAEHCDLLVEHIL